VIQWLSQGEIIQCGSSMNDIWANVINKWRISMSVNGVWLIMNNNDNNNNVWLAISKYVNESG